MKSRSSLMVRRGLARITLSIIVYFALSFPLAMAILYLFSHVSLIGERIAFILSATIAMFVSIYFAKLLVGFYLRS